MSIVDDVHGSLLAEGHASPRLLADVARLETYVSETYSARSFVELLQNADDAGASRFRAVLVGNNLLCANDGRPFTPQDLLSLCRSGASNKTRGIAIGYRGIGFKSVVSLASEVHVISGPIRCSFARALSAAALGVPEADVPLVRIPHPIVLGPGAAAWPAVEALLSEGLSTVFVLGGIDIRRMAADADGLTPDCLMFLRNITSVRLDLGGQAAEYTCERGPPNRSRRLRLVWAGQSQDWEVISHSDGVDFAFALHDGRRVPTRADAGLVFAYLPSFETTGLGVRINADFSTDPSRTRIVLDEATLGQIEVAAKLTIGMMDEVLAAGSAGVDTLACLAVTFDLATIEFQRPCFRTELAKALRRAAEGRLGLLALRPAWLNPDDYKTIIETTGHRGVALSEAGQDEGQVTTTLRYLGARTASDETLAAGARKSSLSGQGRAELVAYTIRSADAGLPTVRPLLAVPDLWEAHNGTTTIGDALSRRLAPAAAFEDRLQTAGVSPERLKLLSVGKPSEAPGGQPLTGSEARLPTDPFGQYSSEGRTEMPGIPVWRNGETTVADVLRLHGYEVEDCSRQNIGYDLRARKDGQEKLVEVKLITRPGDPFTLTSNEEAVARKFAEAYYVALIRNLGHAVEIAMIADPANQLPLERQCRQWVWECSRYPYAPMRYGTR
jgi:hypothetical protein